MGSLVILWGFTALTFVISCVSLILAFMDWVDLSLREIFLIVGLLGSIVTALFFKSAYEYTPPKYEISQGWSTYYTDSYTVDTLGCVNFNRNKICGSYTIEKN